jgi:hypothetical protein
MGVRTAIRRPRPLLVTEGSARDKLRAIEGNAYLSHALGQLRAVDLPVVVFGSSLGQQDQRLIDALNEHSKRTVAISMRPGSERELAPWQSDIYGRLDAKRLLFFDATTHPLGYQAYAANPDHDLRSSTGVCVRRPAYHLR